MTNLVSQLFVPVFAGQGTPAITSPHAFEQARHDASSSPGSLLLSACHEAFHVELASLPPDDLEKTGIVVADFKTRDALLAIPWGHYSRNSIISGTRLFLLQSLRYLAFAESSRNSAKSFTSFDGVLKQNAKLGIGILGFSSGILPACVASASSSTLEYITQAIHVYRLAFWIGVRVHSYRLRILKERGLPDDCDLPWSCVFRGINRQLAEEAIEKCQLKDGSLCVTAVLDDDCITISGFPDCLATLRDTFPTGSVVHTGTAVGTLYHSRLHEEIRSLVLADILGRQIRFPDFADIKIPIRSSFTGDVIGCQASSGSLVELVLDMLLVQPVNWHFITRELLKFRDASICLVNVGPGTGIVHSTEKPFPSGKVSVLDLTVFDIQETYQIPFEQVPIAIVGMAVKVPGVQNTSELWKILERNINTVSEIPSHRFSVSDYHDTERARPGRSMKTRTGNFIEMIDEFDNEFFRISPREAKSMDPQQRLLLHTAYEALKDAGYVPNATRSFQQATFGCYVGAATHDYSQNLKDDIDVYYNTGTLKAFLSGRISYVMGFGGPSIVVDTACSSSSVALYQGCRALMLGDCNAALVGGVNAITSPDMFIGLDRGHMLSPTGQCKTFDASADGYSRSEGCGVFVIKRLSDARAENDNILGVIRGIEINQSGSASSITHPHFATQKALLERLLEKSGVEVDRVNVVEAHGTGTQAGDITEVASIRSVFNARRKASNPLYITSVKANIGHLEAASGAASLAKLLLMLQHRAIPKQISLRQLNPDIQPLELDHTIIPTTQTYWPPPHDGMTRMALLNNFGAAGSNSALLLEEYQSPAYARLGHLQMPFVFGVSAKTERALRELRSKYIQWLQNSTSLTAQFADIAYTMTARRQIYPYRLTVSATDRSDLIQKLGKAPLVHVALGSTDIAFAFSGQGGQYFGMGRTLYRTCPVFRSLMDDCHSILVELGFPGILQVIDSDSREVESSFKQEIQQTAIVALEYSLARLWMTWGLSPSVVIGHSIGEYSALAIANVLTIKDALVLVATRARLMVQKCKPDYTGMLAVNTSPTTVQDHLKYSPTFAGLSIACFNSPTDCVVAGTLEQLKTFKRHLDHNIHCRSTLLPVPFGFHSAAMTPLMDDLLHVAQRVTVKAPTLPIVSTVIGEIIMPGDNSVFHADYFVNHCLKPVLFEKCVNYIQFNGDLVKVNTWIEIGSHATLLPMLRCNPVIPRKTLLLPSLRKEQDPWSTLTESLCDLYRSNVEVHWREVFAHLPTVSCVKLPSYPFLKTQFWVPFEEGSPNPITGVESKATNQIADYAMRHTWTQYPSGSNENVVIFKTPISQLADAIQGHKVVGLPLCPVSVYLEQVFAAVELVKRGTSLMVDESHHFRPSSLEFVSPLVYDACVNCSVETHITLDDGVGSFTITSLDPSSCEKIVHVQGKLHSQLTTELDTKFSRVLPSLIGQIYTLAESQAREIFSTTTVYDIILSRVVDYSEAYRTIQSITIDRNGMKGYAIAKLTENHGQSTFILHQTFMDTPLHVAGLMANLQCGVNDVFICTEVGSVEVLSDVVDYELSFGVYCRTSWNRDEELMVADAYIIQLASPWRVVAHFGGMRFRRVRLDNLKRGLALAVSSSHYSKVASSGQWSHHVSTSKNKTPEGKSSITEDVLSGLEAEVLQVISDTCNIDVTLDHHMDLASLGIDSLLTIELIQRLRDVVPAADLQPHQFIPCRTLGDVIKDICSGSSMATARSMQACSGTSSPRTLVHDDNVFDLTISNFNSKFDAKQIIASILCIDFTVFDDDADFGALGMDSLTSIEALHVLQKELGVGLPRDLFVICPTIRSVNAFLDGHRGSSDIPTPIAPTKIRTPEDVTLDYIGSFRLQGPLVPIQRCETAGGVSLILIHDGSGFITYYDRLPSLDRDIWAISNPKLTTGGSWDSLNSMALAYVKYVTEMIPGPLIIGGWSFGGVVAFEAARILLGKGVVVKGVMLIDSPSPVNHEPLSDQLIDRVVDNGWREACSDISVLLKDQFRTNSCLLAAHDPFSYDGPLPHLVLLRSSEGLNTPDLCVPAWLAERADPKTLVGEWEAIVGKPIKVLSIPGNHFQVFESVQIADVALRIVEGCHFLENMC